MLRFNSFRSKRYLRTRFVEGNFLLASEATDLELEILDLLRTSVKHTVGDVAIDEAWKVERLTDTSVLVKPGEAWFRGLPFIQRFGKDQLVTGAVLSLGTTPVGVTATDHPDGLGKIINFNDSNTTPTNTYRFVISATEELVTATKDPFLQNANLTETTAQKVRLNYRINIVPASLQDNSPVPYRDEDSTSTSTTNFPDNLGNSAPNFVNDIVITPTSGGDGEQLNLTNVTGSEQIDGRDVEITVRNASSTLPSTASEQRKFSNGKLIDSNGSEFHINQIFTGNVSTEIVIRIDKEPGIDKKPGQPNPEIINTKPYTLIKRDVYTTDDANGVPQGRLHWAIADLEWDSTKQINHSSKVTDLRNVIEEDIDFQDKANKKDNSLFVGGGDISWNATTSTLTWTNDFKIMNPASPIQTVSTSSAVLVSSGFLVYEQDLTSGGIIERGQLLLTVSSAGSTSTLSGSPDLSQIRIGNIIKDSAGTIAEITAVDNTNDEITTSPALTGTGTANVYLDSFSATGTKLTSDSITLAARYGSKVYVGLNDLELEDGETGQLGDGISQELLQLLGSGITESTSSPTYSSNIRGTSGEGFQERLGVLTDAEGDNQEDRSAYIRSDQEVTWTGTQLEFSSDIILEVVNTKTGTTTTHAIEASNSPISIADGESLYINIDRTTNEIVSPILSGTTAIPAQTQADKDVFVLFKRIDTTEGNQLHLPFSKQVIVEGQTSFLGASGTGSAVTKATFLDPLSTALPTGSTVTIDNVSGQNGDTVLFTNLSSGNNRVYELQGVGSSITWTAVRAFNGDLDPTDGDSVRIQKGDTFQEQLAVFDSTQFTVNDTVRFFDGISADFWELSSIKTSTLTDNTTGSVFEVNATGSENFIVSYSIIRGANKETGEIYITSDGTDVSVSRSTTVIGDVGVEFSGDISSGDLRLRYTTTSTGSNATMKYFTKRWSNSAGGPSGIPNYTGFTGSTTTAAGSIEEVQFHGTGGNLDTDSRFKWDTTEGALELNGLFDSALKPSTTINDNQTTPLTIISHSAVTFKYAIVEYSVERNNKFRTGRMLISNDATSTVGFSDDFVETSSTGVAFSAQVSSNTLEVQYTSTSTGFTGTFKYKIKKWG